MNRTLALRNLVARGGAFALGAMILLAGSGVASVASAQIAPRIMIAMDTSGSMALDLDGVPTFGDGVTTGCTVSSSVYCGTNCTAGIDTDCNGVPDDSRLFVAKQALRDVLYSAGDDIEWSLSRFSQSHALNNVCAVRDGYAVQNLECAGFVTSYGNPQCSSGSAFTFCGGGVVNTADWPAACRPGTGGRPSFRQLTAAGPEVCINYDSDSCTGTAASGDVLVGFPGLGAFSGISNIPAMLRWIDNRETMFSTSTTSGNFCAHATTGDCELRPVGPTPLAGVLNAAGAYMAGVRAGDAASSCRPYSVILITDGAETCSGNPAGAATTLRTGSGIRTYVIGMAISGGSRALLNSIATAGGTDAGAPGGDTAFFADDPTTLAAGLAQIIQDSLLVEVCNGLDDDCDTRIDEGVLNACGGCGAVPAESCNGADEDCDGRTDEGVANACGTCGPTPPEVCNGLDDNCNGIIDEGVCGGCTPTTEVCDNIDNDCDTRIDEGVTRACGPHGWPLHHRDSGLHRGHVRRVQRHRTHDRDLQRHRRRLRWGRGWPHSPLRLEHRRL